jgi:RNA polymerase sigma-70 factor (sigma-E family)
MAMTEATFDERFDALSAIAYRVAFRLLGDRGEAEEVAQEALARAYSRWRKVAGYDEPWVARVALNLALGRTRRRRTAFSFDESTDAARTGQEAAAAERLDLLQALQALPRRQREVVALRYLADLPEAEVASVLDISPGSVKQHAHRGIGRLRLDLAPTAPTLLPLIPEADDA